MQGRQNAAKIRVEEIRNDLGYYILKNSAVLIVMRDFEGTQAVIESAKKNPDANIILDALTLEKKIFRQIWNDKATAYTYNSEVVNRINILMSEVGQKIGALSMDTLIGDGKYYGTLRTREAMVDRIERALHDTYGDELKLHFFRSMITDEINARLHRDAVNVIFVNVVPPLVRAFSSYSNNTQILSNESEATVKTTRKAPTAHSTGKVTGPTQPTPQPRVLTPDVVPTPQVAAAPKAEVAKTYTGAKRGRKTNAERAALAVTQGTDTSTSQNEG